jgi:predicted ribosomally synthesized peptide with nif11-like leader
MKSGADFANRVTTAETVEDMAAFLKARGFEFAREELHGEFSALTEVKLNSVVGGSDLLPDINTEINLFG